MLTKIIPVLIGMSISCRRKTKNVFRQLIERSGDPGQKENRPCCRLDLNAERISRSRLIPRES